jgi:peptidoglycan/LPS O-acetylase OafA/YrhL
MKPLIAKIKPASGFSRVVYVVFNVLLPLVVFALVRTDFVQLALAIILLSKWRMFAVRPRFWPANIRANAVDIIVGVSLLLFMVHTDSQLVQLLLTALYIGWLVVLKPSSTPMMVSLQALVSMLFGLMAIFVGWGDGPLYGLVLATGLVCYLAARHFFDSFDEPYAKLLSYMWGYFGSALVWVLGHWLIYYGVVAAPVLLLLSIGFGLATLYYLDHHDRLSIGVRRQVVFIMVAVVVIVVIFSGWTNKIV